MAKPGIKTRSNSINSNRPTSSSSNYDDNSKKRKKKQTKQQELIIETDEDEVDDNINELLNDKNKLLPPVPRVTLQSASSGHTTPLYDSKYRKVCVTFVATKRR